MKNIEIARRRMHAQRLWSRPHGGVVEVARHLLAVQAQEAAAAKFSFGARARRGGAAVVEVDVDAALDAGALLRTHVLRPTWHYVAAADLRWLVRLTAPRVRQLSSFMMKKVALDAATLARARALLTTALAQRALTRDELVEVFVAGGVPDPSGVRLAYLLQDAELDALICSGPVRGKQQTWALVDDRAPLGGRRRARVRPSAGAPAGGSAVVPASGDTAGDDSGGDDSDGNGDDNSDDNGDGNSDDPAHDAARLVDVFFRTRGPATVKDCAMWASLTTSTVEAALGDAALTRAVVGDREYFFDAAVSDEPPDTTRVDLVQGYDEITAGYSDSRDVFFGHLKGQDPHERPPLLHTVLLDGQLIGHWRPGPGTAANKGKVVVETLLYRPLSRAERSALDDALARYGVFLGKAVVAAS